MSEHFGDIFGTINQAAAAQGEKSLQFRMGEIKSYDPAAGTVTVHLKPGDQETGDIPFMTPWAGNGWGQAAGPTVGMPVLVLSLDADQEHMMAMSGYYNDVFKAPAPKPGEWWVSHEKLQYVKLLNDGRTVIGSKESIDLSTTEDPLNDDDSIVRKKDLQRVIDYINGTLRNWLIGAPHLGNFGMPVVVNPATLPAFTEHPAATASNIAKAEGT